MSLNDGAAIVNVVGVVLEIIFAVRWRGRQSRNAVVGNIGIAMVVTSPVAQIALWFSGRT